MPRTFHWKWVGLLALTLTPGLALAQAAAPQTHTVREGDTLWDLAKHYRGDPFLWPDIYRMNTERRGRSALDLPRRGASVWPAATACTRSRPPIRPSRRRPRRPTARRCRQRPADGGIRRACRHRGAGARGRRRAAPAPQQATLAQLTAVSANEPGEEQGLFGPKRAELLEESLQAYTHQPYRPLRRSEFYSSGFLTENQKLPFGKVLGPVTPAADQREQRQRRRAALLDHRHRGAARRHVSDRRHAARRPASVRELQLARRRGHPHRPGPDQRYRAGPLRRHRRGHLRPDPAAGSVCCRPRSSRRRAKLTRCRSPRAFAPRSSVAPAGRT